MPVEQDQNKKKTSTKGTNMSAPQENIPEDNAIRAEFAQVAISMLNVDHENYQRDQIPAHIKQISENFCVDLFGPPTVAVRADGTMWIIDGQQRTAAAALVGIKEIPVKIVRPSSVQEEADLYTRLNVGAKKLNATQLYRGCLGYGEPIAMEIQKVLDEVGLDGPNGSKSRRVQAIGGMRNFFGPRLAKIDSKPLQWELEEGADHLRWSLTLLADIGESLGQPSAVCIGPMLNATNYLTKNVADLASPEEVAEILKGMSLKELNVAVTGSERNAGGNLSREWGEALLALINDRAGRTVMRLLD